MFYSLLRTQFSTRYSFFYLGDDLGVAIAAEYGTAVPYIEAVETIAEDHRRRRRAAAGLPRSVYQKLLVCC